MTATIFGFATALSALLAGLMFLRNATRRSRADDATRRPLRVLKAACLLVLAVVYVLLAAGIVQVPNDIIILLVRADLFVLFAAIFAYGLLER